MDKAGQRPPGVLPQQRRAQSPLPYSARSVTPRELKGTDRASLTRFCGGTRKVVAKKGKFRPGWMCQGLGVSVDVCVMCGVGGGWMWALGACIVWEPPRSQPGLQQAGVTEPSWLWAHSAPCCPFPLEHGLFTGERPPSRLPHPLHAPPLPAEPIQTNWEP